MFATDSGSERATSIEEYQTTCTDFITDISRDYIEWINRYHLGEQETSRRKRAISNIVKTTNDWIVKYGTTIKKVDVVMNDGVNKMAENTAGYPFQFDIFVNNMSRYTTHPVGDIRVNIKATPRPGRRARIGNYQKDRLFPCDGRPVWSRTSDCQSGNPGSNPGRRILHNLLDVHIL